MADDVKAPVTGEIPVPVTPPGSTEPKTPSTAPTGLSQGVPVPVNAAQQPSASQEARTLRELKDGEEPDGEERFAISPKAFKERLDRAKKRVYKELLGVDDPNEAKKLVEKYKGLEKKAEEQRLAEMSERDRERERRKRIEAEFEGYKKQVRTREVTQAVSEVENVVTGIAKDLVREKYMKHAIRDFQEYVGKMSEAQADAFYNEEDIRGWFDNYSKEFEVGKTLPPKEEAMNVGAGVSKQDPKAPIQPKDGKIDLSTKGGMTKRAINEYLKKLGMSTRV